MQGVFRACSEMFFVLEPNQKQAQKSLIGKCRVWTDNAKGSYHEAAEEIYIPQTPKTLSFAGLDRCFWS